MKVVFIGAGNVATHLSAAMRQAGLCICQIYSRTEENAQRLAAEHACAWTTDTGALRSDADLYVFALKDAVLHKIVAQVSPNEGLWLHTAGSVPMDIFRGYARCYGVLYPLQTFSKKRPVDFRNVPCFIEADSAQSEQRLRTLAEKTILSVSPHKDYSVISHIGKPLAATYGVGFLDQDFKKKAKFQRSVELSKKYNLYRQDYCGCVFANYHLKKENQENV